MMQICVRLYGPLRGLYRDDQATLLLADGACVGDVRNALSQLAQQSGNQAAAGMLAVSAIADEQAILRDHDLIHAGAKLAVLPPVNGG